MMIKKMMLAAAVAAAALTTGCNDFHTSGNGALDGFWQLVQADTLEKGASGDLRPSKIFWSVQADLLELQDLKGDIPSHHVFFRFELKDGSLRLWNPVYDSRVISDSIITDVNTVAFYGICGLKDTLKVLRLDDERMTLENRRLRFHFRKY